MEEYEFERFTIRDPSELLFHLKELGKEGWHNVVFLSPSGISFIMQRKVKDFSSNPPDDTNPQLLSEQAPEPLRQQ